MKCISLAFDFCWFASQIFFLTGFFVNRSVWDFFTRLESYKLFDCTFHAAFICSNAAVARLRLSCVDVSLGKLIHIKLSNITHFLFLDYR
ncbi:hypothetical protein [Escherichia Stx1 converting phage]|uniref:Uncharacterized protein n=1 Tax=Escherichia phage Stx2 II TaxID=194949 RepID=Q7Y2L3_9CAUD|nr:hypothetical protein Stx1_p120 [Escherichia Stx1 converting phage]NP_859364.1 hypothetical protein Stx2II_p119 [Escherichia phage Stx2 II]BAC77935.1 hypothetical protein [Escherichia Stx1 converting phage]BAC78101.1 hypothetical protein [Escherichia phage Stx2 II]